MIGIYMSLLNLERKFSLVICVTFRWFCLKASFLKPNPKFDFCAISREI